MPTPDVQETIAALATPPGEGGIAVIRISGPDALRLTDRGFRGKTSLASSKSHRAHVGDFFGPGGEPLDQVVATVFRGPTSYTGEDVVEISCHGGVLVSWRILSALISYGCRPAAPGEFTKRAFINGRMDLSQAEAVADLIHARSERSQKSSLQHLRGELATKINQFRAELIQTAGLIELELDFAEEGLELTEQQKVMNQLESTIETVSGLLSTYHTGRMVRDGVKVVLAGMPNVGKSSILNALLRQDRAIVTEVPGTTRDTIEESLFIHGLQFRIVDTAGLREAVDRVEQEGIRRSEDEIRTSDLLLVVLDSSRPPGMEEMELAGRLVGDLRGSVPAIVVLNKIDLAGSANKEIEHRARILQPQAVVQVSALTGVGMDDLRESLFEASLSGGGGYGETGLTVTNSRHYYALEKARKSLQLARESLKSGASGEFISVDLRAALDALGEITGAVTTDNILNEIFANFCIGK